MANPSTTQAILVGIERYASPRSIKDLNGPAKDVLNFCQWLRDRNVPTENISVFVSPLDRNQEVVEQINNLTANEASVATKDIVNKALREGIRKKTASSFILFWSGHGWISPQGDRRLIFADATLDNLKNLNLSAELNAMQTDLYNNLPQQLLIFDACANSQLLNIIPPEDIPAIGKHLPSQEQMVLFAANPGEYADNLGEGRFTRELLNELQLSQYEDSWLPDMEAVIKNVQQKFIRLREKGETKQTPSYWMYKDWKGNIKEGFSKIESVSKSVNNNNYQLPRKLTIKELGQLRDCFLECDSIQNPKSRQDIILNLRKEISSKVDMGDKANSVVLSMIKTSRSYSGGLAEVLDVMDMLYENDSVEMQNLRKIVMEMLPEEFADR